MKKPKLVSLLLCLVLLLGCLPLSTLADDESGIAEENQIEQTELTEEETDTMTESQDTSDESSTKASGRLKAAPVLLSDTAKVTENNINYVIDTGSGTASVESGKPDSNGVITVPDTITYDGVTYPVTSVGDKAFYGRYGLVWNEAYIGANVTSIGAKAFGSGLDTVSRIQFNGSSCQSIAADAFDWITLASGFELIVMGPEGCMDDVLRGVIDLKGCAVTYIDEHEPSIDIQQLVNDAPDNEEYTITVSEDITLKKSVTIPAGKNIVITGEEFTIKSSKIQNVEELFNISDGASLAIDGSLTLSGGSSNKRSQGNIADVSGGTFILRNGTLKNGKITSSLSGAVLVRDGGSFIMSGGSIESFTLNGDTLTAPVVVSPASEFIFEDGTIKNNKNYSNNNAPVSSGVLLYTWNKGEAPAEMTMNGGSITENMYCSGVYLIGSTDFEMNGGTISGNKGTYGGGVCVAGAPGGQSYEDFTTKFVMNGGSISENESYNAGGGIYVNSSDVTLNGGRIENNTARSHGGGVYVSEMPHVLHVNNAVVTDNEVTSLGGGLWFCPSGEAYLNVNRGVAVYDNTAAEAGDDFVSVGKGTGHVTLASRMLGGGRANWHADGGVITTSGQPAPLETGMADPSAERYSPENPGHEITAEESSEGYALKALPSDSAKELALSKASLIISGNKAERGGGIGSNGVVIFGDDENEWSVRVTKTWDLNTPAGYIRPVTVYLKAGDTLLDSVILSEENSWTAEFTGLPAPDPENGITYSAVENPVPENFREEYSEAEYDAETHTVSIRIKNSYVAPSVTPPVYSPFDTVIVAGEKTWDDNNNRDNVRPEQIKINLLADGRVINTRTVTAVDGWKWSFDKLPAKDDLGNDIKYSISEEPVPGYTAVYDHYSVKNIYTGSTVDIPVKKVWDDDEDSAGIRPSSVTVYLYADNVKAEDRYLVLNSANNWSGVFNGLPKYSGGTAIDYEIREVPVAGYSAEISGDSKAGFTVTNSIISGEGLGSGTGIEDEDNEDYSANGSSSDETETGDASHAVFWMFLMTADAVILTLLLRRRHRADSNQPR